MSRGGEGSGAGVRPAVDIEQLQPRFKDAARMLAEAEEILAFTAFPKLFEPSAFGSARSSSRLSRAT